MTRMTRSVSSLSALSRFRVYYETTSTNTGMTYNSLVTPDSQVSSSDLRRWNWSSTSLLTGRRDATTMDSTMTTPRLLYRARTVSCFNSDGGTAASRAEFQEPRENNHTIHGGPFPISIPPQRLSENSIARSTEVTDLTTLY
jgi:hypothetical protein